MVFHEKISSLFDTVYKLIHFILITAAAAAHMEERVSHMRGI